MNANLRAAGMAAALAILPLSTGCLRRIVGQSPAGSRPASASPDSPLRAVFQQQTQGAFNPLTDDRRVQSLQARLKTNPRDPQARLDLAVVFEEYRYYDEALEQYTEALRLARSERAALGVARSARATGRAVDAVTVLQTFLKDAPTANAWNELGLIHEQTGDLAAAENALRQAIALDAQSSWLHNNLGYNLMRQEKTAEAESAFRRALELNPKSATSRNNLGTILARCGNVEEALKQFQSVADRATAHNNLASVLLETGEYERSREELLKALAIRPYFAPALANYKLVQERLRGRGNAESSSPAPPAQCANTLAQSKDSKD